MLYFPIIKVPEPSSLSRVLLNRTIVFLNRVAMAANGRTLGESLIKRF